LKATKIVDFEIVLIAEGETEIDHDNTSCMAVPNLTIENYTGPKNCTGTLSLANYEKGHLPYVERRLVFDFTEHPHTPYPADPYYDTESEFVNLCPSDCDEGEIDELECIFVDRLRYVVDDIINDAPSFINGARTVYWTGEQWSLVEGGHVSGEEIATGGTDKTCPLGLWTYIKGYGYEHEDDECFCVSRCDDIKVACGCCTQVCSRLCLTGRRHWDGPSERVEFKWFEEWLTPPDPENYDGPLVVRGWRYQNDELDQSFLDSQ
jgi:hypothetical protein